MPQSLDLSSTFVHLSNRGETELIQLTPSFWRGTARGKHYDRVVGIFEFRSSKDLHSPMQEVHPEADELLYVVSGAIDAVVEEGGAERIVKADTESAVRQIVAAINERIVQVNSRTTSGPATSVMPLNVDRVIQEWRNRRS